MNIKRLLPLTAFAFAIAAVFVTARIQAQPDTIKQIAPGVWFRQGDIDGKGHCNNVIIEMKDYLVVIDANFPDGARLTMADAAKVSKKPIKWVFDTHHHGDHAYANAVWTKAGAKTLAHIGVAQEMKRYEPNRWKGANRKDVSDLNLPTAEPPQQTFDKSPFVLDDGSRRIEFHHFGWAHTRGDGFAYLPKEQILCTGDAVTNGPYNFMGDGHVANWPNVVANALKLKVQHVLPGHGPNGGKEVLTGEQTFMREIYAGVAKLKKAGKSADDLTKMGMDKSLEGALGLSAASKNWVGKSLAQQAVVTYEEIAAGKPHGEIAGGK